MRRTRHSGRTAGEALLLQLHIAGPQKGAGSFSRRRALRLAQAAGPSTPAATRSRCRAPAGVCVRACGLARATNPPQEAVGRFRTEMSDLFRGGIP
jgi:hypothetical protein